VINAKYAIFQIWKLREKRSKLWKVFGKVLKYLKIKIDMKSTKLLTRSYKSGKKW